MCKKSILSVFWVLVLAVGWLGSADAADSGLVGWWKFDEGSGTVAADSSANGRDGTLVSNPVWRQDGVHNGCLFFDGAQAHVRIPNQDSLNPRDGSFTFTFWANVETAPGTAGTTNWDLAVNKRDAGSVGYYIGADRNQGTADQTAYRFMLGDTGATRRDTPFVAVPLGEWVFVAAVLDRDMDEHRISVDGGQNWATATPPPGPIAPNVDLGIGWDIGVNNYWFHGRIDDVRLYDWPLSANELAIVMEGGEGFPLVRRPDPEDGAVLGATWVNLMWMPGSFAVSHDLYLGTSFDDVNDGAEGTFIGNLATNSQILGFTGFPIPDGLVPGTTYYWRVDEVNDANPDSPWRGDVWSFTVQAKTAHNPVPGDGDRFVETDVTLQWTAGFQARLHSVYFGDNFDEVSAAAGGTSQTAATYVPGALEPGKTYYWRVDEFDAATTHKGDVWSFTTRPAISIVDPNLVGWWKLDEGSGTTALDWSGHDNHGSLVDGPKWVDGIFGGALELGPANYLEINAVADDLTSNEVTLGAWINTADTGVWVWWFSCNTASGGNVVILGLISGQITLYEDGEEIHSETLVHDSEWHHVAYTRIGDRGYLYVDGVPEGTHDASYDFSPDNLWSIGQEYDAGPNPGDFLDGIVDDVRIYNMSMTQPQILELLRGDPVYAGSPSPANGSTSDVVRALPLNWSPGESASQHAVYFGTGRDAVAGADTADTTGVFRGLQAGTSYTPPEGVEWAGGPYYWRIDEHNTDGTVTKGNTWNFSVADYILVEDFEAYNDIETGEPGSNLVYETWLDGFGIDTNGSTMGYAAAFQPTMETDIVHGGRQSAPLMYDNTTAALSEVTLTMAAQDWTTHSVKTLGLWFHGTAGNTGKLYVKVNGSKVVYDGDPADMQRAWQAWNIDLALFGVNLQSVTSLVIGVEGAGATGTVLLDDIRLYALSRELITPVQPNAAALVGHWALDGNLQDSSGLGNHGTLNGNPTYTLGKVGQAMRFDGSEDYVAIDGVADDITNNDITLAAWVNMPPEGVWYPVISCNTATYGNVGWLAVDASGGADFGSLTGTMFVTDENWHHIAYTRIGETGSLYVDGVLEGTHTEGLNFSADNLWSIGQEWDGGPTASNFLIGTVDDVRIYDYGMSYAEVAGLAGRTMPFDKPF